MVNRTAGGRYKVVNFLLHLLIDLFTYIVIISISKCYMHPIFVTPEHKTSLRLLGYIFNNSQQYTVWVKIIDFLLCQKSLGY